MTKMHFVWTLFLDLLLHHILSELINWETMSIMMMMKILENISSDRMANIWSITVCIYMRIEDTVLSMLDKHV